MYKCNLYITYTKQHTSFVFHEGLYYLYEETLQNNEMSFYSRLREMLHRFFLDFPKTEIRAIYVAHDEISGSFQNSARFSSVLEYISTLLPKVEQNILQTPLFAEKATKRLTFHDCLCRASNHPAKIKIISTCSGTANEVLSIYKDGKLQKRRFGAAASFALLLEHTRLFFLEENRGLNLATSAHSSASLGSADKKLISAFVIRESKYMRAANVMQSIKASADILAYKSANLKARCVLARKFRRLRRLLSIEITALQFEEIIFAAVQKIAANVVLEELNIYQNYSIELIGEVFLYSRFRNALFNSLCTIHCFKVTESMAALGLSKD